jgi:hypothetical protein
MPVGRTVLNIGKENAEIVGKPVLALYNNNKDQNGRCPELPGKER